MTDDVEREPHLGPSRRSGPPWSLIGLVLVAIVSAVFVVQNRERTEIEFLFFSVESRVWVAIAVAIALGIVLDRLLLGWWRRARARRND